MAEPTGHWLLVTHPEHSDHVRKHSRQKTCFVSLIIKSLKKCQSNGSNKQLSSTRVHWVHPVSHSVFSCLNQIKDKRYKKRCSKGLTDMCPKSRQRFRAALQWRRDTQVSWPSLTAYTSYNALVPEVSDGCLHCDRLSDCDSVGHVTCSNWEPRWPPFKMREPSHQNFSVQTKK